MHDTDPSALEHVRDHETGPQLANRRKVELVAELRSKALLTERVLDELGSFMDAAAAEAQHEGGVLVHGDLTEDHLLLARQGGRWAITGLLDFGDAHVCPREYDWPALWLDLLRQDVTALRAFFASYDAAALRDRDFTRRAFVWSLFHDFGTEIVEDALARRPGTAVGSIDDLRELLWPAGILGA